jgi:hypothetical protein
MLANPHRRFSQVVAGSAAGHEKMERWQDKSREVRGRSEGEKHSKFKRLVQGAQGVTSLPFRPSGCLALENRTSRGRTRP